MKRSIVSFLVANGLWRCFVSLAAAAVLAVLALPVRAQSCLPPLVEFEERLPLRASARPQITGGLLNLGWSMPAAEPAGGLREELRRLLRETAGPPAEGPAKASPPQIEGRKFPSPGFQWEPAFRQAMAFLAVQHAFRLATEPGSRAELKGPFFRDYFATLKRLRGWDDGDPFLVNYIGHPMMGSVSGFIQIQNDPGGIRQEAGLRNRAYWKSRLKAMAWSFGYSTQFELGLVSEASLGNVGIRPYDGRKHPMAYVDLVVTPVLGTGWLVGEDLLDKYLIRPLENRIPNRIVRVLFRGFLNPTRSFANLMRGEMPWHRDNRP